MGHKRPFASVEPQASFTITNQLHHHQQTFARAIKSSHSGPMMPT
jgi:hypothetical protein